MHRFRRVHGDSGVCTVPSDPRRAGRAPPPPPSNQVLDANWTVCAQNVAPGAEIATGSMIDFAAVRVEESC